MSQTLAQQGLALPAALLVQSPRKSARGFGSVVRPEPASAPIASAPPAASAAASQGQVQSQGDAGAVDVDDLMRRLEPPSTINGLFIAPRPAPAPAPPAPDPKPQKARRKSGPKPRARVPAEFAVKPPPRRPAASASSAALSSSVSGSPAAQGAQSAAAIAAAGVPLGQVRFADDFSGSGSGSGIAELGDEDHGGAEWTAATRMQLSQQLCQHTQLLLQSLAVASSPTSAADVGGGEEWKQTVALLQPLKLRLGENVLSAVGAATAASAAASDSSNVVDVPRPVSLASLQLLHR